MRTFHTLWILAALAVPPIRADAIGVGLDTTVLLGNPDAPFYLNFQLNGSAGNTAVLSLFTGIGALQGPDGSVSFGDYSATPTQVTLSTLTSPFNSVVIPFTPGASLGFLLTLSGNGAPFPDQFSFAILRSGYVEIPLDPATTAGLLGALLTVDISGGGQVQIGTAGGDPFQPPYDLLAPPTVQAVPSAVPEPAAGWLAGVALAGICLWRYKLTR